MNKNAKFKIGVHTFSLKELREAESSKEFYSAIDPVEQMKKSIGHGFRHFEITYDINMLMPGFQILKKTDELKLMKKDYGLTYTVHLPFRAVELCYPDNGVKQAFVNLIVKAIHVMEPLIPEAYVVHGNGKLGEKAGRFPDNSYIMKYITKQTEEVLHSIIDKSGISPGRIAIENLNFPFAVLDDVINKTGVNVCMDVGHLAAGFSGSFTIKTFLEKYYEKIINIHLHDGYNRMTDNGRLTASHLGLGKGDVDYVRLLNELKQRGYDKSIVLEMKFDDAKTSKEILDNINL